MKHVMEKLDNIAAYVTAIALILILLVTSIDVNCFNRGFFAEEYKKLNTAEELGMTEQDLHLATNTLLDYLQDEKNSIKAEITVQGTTMLAFNSKEEAHMKDVRGLYHFAIGLRNFCAVLLLASMIYLITRMKKGAFTLLSINYMKTAILFAVFLIMLAGWAYVDFDAFWTTFHKITFRNDLWLLDPNTDLMINLFPSAFFSSLVFRIVAMFTACFAGVFAAGYFYLRHQLKKYHEELSYEEN